ncbi:27693_t:CDS:1, partial [Racocetra persica]
EILECRDKSTPKQNRCMLEAIHCFYYSKIYKEKHLFQQSILEIFHS